MSLAYMAELGTVFNLAYAELTKGRYIAQITRISQLTALLGQTQTTNKDDTIKLGQLVKRIDDLACYRFFARWTAWGEMERPMRFRELCGSLGVLLYRNGNDRTLAFTFAFISSLIVVLATAADHWSFVDYGWVGEQPWAWLTHPITEKVFFLLLFLAMAAPLLFVVFGRRVAKVAGVVAEEVTATWNSLADKRVEEMLPDLKDEEE